MIASVVLLGVVMIIFTYWRHGGSDLGRGGAVGNLPGRAAMAGISWSWAIKGGWGRDFTGRAIPKFNLIDFGIRQPHIPLVFL